jgi:hypothetical protein
MATGTVGKSNFDPVSSIIMVERSAFELVDRTLANPDNAVALVDGEWMTLNSTGLKVQRATAIASVGDQATQMSFPWWQERGDSSVQANGKGAILSHGDWVADTNIYNSTLAVGSGAAMTLLGPVKVATITLGGRNYSGLVGHGGSGDTAIVVGYVALLPSNNGGRLRVRRRLL